MPISCEQKCLNKISKTALEMKEGKIDIIEGIREIYALWINAGLEENDIYLYLKVIDSDTDQIIKGDIRKNFSKEFLEDQKKFEEEYLKAETPFIDKLIEELIQIPIIEEKEDPYP